MKRFINACHGHLDNVGSGALNGGVDGKGAHGAVVRIDVGQIASAPKQRLGIAFFACLGLGPLHIFVHLWKRLEVAINQRFSLGATDVETLGQAEGGDAVDDAEVGTLGTLYIFAAVAA